MALKLDQLLEPGHREDRLFFRVMIPNFAFAPTNHLRQQPLEPEFTATLSFSRQHLRLNEQIPQQMALATNRITASTTPAVRTSGTD